MRRRRLLQRWMLCLMPRPWIPAFGGMTTFDMRGVHLRRLLQRDGSSPSRRPWIPAFGEDDGETARMTE